VVAFPLTFRKISQEKMKRLHPSLIVLRIQPLPIPPPRNPISRERIIASASMTGVNCTLKQVTREPRAERIYGQAREEEKKTSQPTYLWRSIKDNGLWVVVRRWRLGS